MKTSIAQIKIAEPCSQKWVEMENHNQDKFCAACSKCVIDFTNYSNAEIIKTLANADSEICGRLSKTQLNQLNYHLIVVPENRNWMKYLGVLAIGASVFFQEANASVPGKPAEIVKTIKGKTLIKNKDIKINREFYGYIFIENGKPAVGLKLQIKNTNLIATTDQNGRYQFTLDDNFDRKLNVLIIKESDYVTEFHLDFNTPKQQNYYPSKVESIILGKIMYVPKKGKKT